MSLNKTPEDLGKNPIALKQPLDTYPKIINFAIATGITPGSFSTAGYEGFNNCQSNCAYLKPQIEMSGEKLAKTVHDLSFIAPEVVIALSDIYNNYKFVPTTIAGKVSLLAFTLEPKLIGKYIPYLVENGVFNPAKSDYSKTELAKILDLIIEAEYDEIFAQKITSATDYLEMIYPTEMIAINSLKEKQSNVDIEGLMKLIIPYIEETTDYTYTLKTGIVISKQRVENNMRKLVALGNINQDAIIAIALFNDSAIITDSIEETLSLLQPTIMGNVGGRAV